MEKELSNKEKEILKIVNNVLYFNDNSDYSTALFKILFLLRPEIKNEEYPEEFLDYID